MVDMNEKLNKEVVEKMPVKLKSIYEVLIVAFEQLGVAKDADLVVAIGNTGSGKSTMLSSIIYGPDALHITEIEQTYTKKVRGKETIAKRKKKVIDQKNPQDEFAIGHSLASSKTFMPHFRKKE